MAIKEFDPLSDGRPSRVRFEITVSMAERVWRREEVARVAAGGTIEWVFEGLRVGDRPEIRFVKRDPLPNPRSEDAGLPPRTKPIQTEKRPRFDQIEGTTFRDARGTYRFEIDVARNGQTIELHCVPDGMGGVDVSGPPRP